VRRASIAALAAAGLSVSACNPAADPAGGLGPGRVINVVAAENFWGSIARQVGGAHVRVVSIITNPNADPHSYEPTVADAKAVALAGMVIENGIGYDPWLPRLLAADSGQQTVLDVGHVLGVAADGNPHRWYSPPDVRTVINRMTADFGKLDPRDLGYFEARRAWYLTVALRPYYALIAAIRARYAGTPVGASESIFAMLAPAVRLRLLTPSAFLRAISEGGEVSAADKATIDRQIARHLIKVYVYNLQNVTPDVQAQVAEARAAGIPVTAITETLVPATATFQAWQDGELRGLLAALDAAAAKGRH
jgi:zinc/manganese transport system substrate-binding protein